MQNRNQKKMKTPQRNRGQVMGIMVLGSVVLALGLSVMPMAHGKTNTTTLENPVTWQTAIWQHIPLNITLPVGHERIIKVPHSAKIGIPEAIANKLVISRFDGWFYITAKAAFEAQSIQIMDNETGQHILVNLSAYKGAPDTAIRIIYPVKSQATSNSTTAAMGALQGSMAFKTLTQYAEQQLYAPKRLLRNPYHITLVQNFVNKQGNVPQGKWLYHLFLDGSVVGMPWVEYSGGGYYVTAVMIRNLLAVRINLTQNLTNLCGRNAGIWQAVTFFPYQAGHMWQLAPRGSHYDTTMAFFISHQPFISAISHCKAGHDE